MSQFKQHELDVLKEYADLKVEARKTAKRMEEIKGEVKTILEREDAQDNPIDVGGLGKLSLRPRKIWTWSEDTQNKLDAIKKQQELEKANGEGTFTEVFDVFFN